MCQVCTLHKACFSSAAASASWLHVLNINSNSDLHRFDLHLLPKLAIAFNGHSFSLKIVYFGHILIINVRYLKYICVAKCLTYNVLTLELKFQDW